MELSFYSGCVARVQGEVPKMSQWRSRFHGTLGEITSTPRCGGNAAYGDCGKTDMAT
jgi:hypothetical protein